MAIPWINVPIRTAITRRGLVIMWKCVIRNPQFIYSNRSGIRFKHCSLEWTISIHWCNRPSLSSWIFSNIHSSGPDFPRGIHPFLYSSNFKEFLYSFYCHFNTILSMSSMCVLPPWLSSRRYPCSFHEFSIHDLYLHRNLYTIAIYKPILPNSTKRTISL